MINFVLMLMFFSSFSATAQWDYGSVSLVGNFNGDYFVKVTNVANEANTIPSYSEKLFKVSEQLGKDGFAIALAAISNKKQVFMKSNVDNQTGEYPIISILYITDKVAAVE